MKKYRFMLKIINMLAKQLWVNQGRDVKEFRALTQKRINDLPLKFIEGILQLR